MVDDADSVYPGTSRGLPQEKKLDLTLVLVLSFPGVMKEQRDLCKKSAVAVIMPETDMGRWRTEPTLPAFMEYFLT